MRVYRIASIILMALIILQPVFVSNTMGSTYSMPKKQMSLTQEPGSRLDPGEYTNHVPIFINGTDDFIAQGWPGSGASDDPFLIHGLNITTSISEPCIRIINTDAYFVISDVWLDHKGNDYAIHFNQVSHATIEYSDIDALDNYAIYINGTQNLEISYCNIHSAQDIALNIHYSEYVSVLHNIISSDDRRAMTISQTDYITSIGNDYITDNPSYYITYFSSSNYIDISNDRFLNGKLTAIRLAVCNYTSINGIYADGQGRGVHASSLDNINITNSLFKNIDTYAIDVSGSTNLLFTNNQFISVSTLLNLQNCQIAEISGGNALDTTASGIIIDDSEYVTLRTIDLGQVAKDGVTVTNSNWIHIENLTVSSTAFTGASLDTVNNTEIRNAQFDGFQTGISMTLSNHIVVESNMFTNVETLLTASQSENLSLFDNDGVVDSDGFSLEICTGIYISNNLITGGDGDGIRIISCTNFLISNNLINDFQQGIFFDNSQDGTVELNSLSSFSWAGIFETSSQNIVIQNNTITDALYGMNFIQNENLTIQDNDLTNCGIYFVPGDPIDSYIHTISNNMVNSKPILYLTDTPAGNVDGTQYGQILLFNSSGTITNGIFERCTAAIEIFYSPGISVTSIISSDNMFGVIAYESENTEIIDSHFESINNNYASYGVSLRISDFSSVSNCSFSQFRNMNDVGVYITSSDNITVSQSSFVSNYIGIKCYTSHNQTYANNEFYHSYKDAIYLNAASFKYTSIINNYIYDSSTGIVMYNLNDFTIAYNTIEHCSLYGINLPGIFTQTGHIFQNNIEECQTGLYISSVDNMTIHDNLFRWNTNYGVDIVSSTNIVIYNNTFVMNLIANGRDNVAMSWDDGVSSGNTWDDYSGLGVYNIDADSIDHYPSKFTTTTPIINQPMDVSYAEGSTGNTITWLPFDDNLKNWSVTIDGYLWDSDAWNFNNITVNIDGLSYGTHIVEVTVWDIYQNYVIDSVMVNIFDDTTPTLSHESDTTLFHGSPNQMIVWTAEDLHPGTYSVTVDGTLFVNGNWEFQTQQIGVDFGSLSVGTHDIIMTVYDIDGNSASDSVRVVVIVDDTAPTIDNPDDVAMNEGTLGQVIIWSPTDEHPDHYKLFINGSLVNTGDWAGERIAISLDGLDVGVYEFELAVYDGAYNSATDTVIVYVLPSGLPTITTTTTPAEGLSPTMIMLILAGTAGTILVIGVIYYIRKKKS